MAKILDVCSKMPVETLVSSLKAHVLDELGMYLNPRMPLKDYRTLAGKLGYTFMRVRNFEREVNPTVSLLEDWWTSYGKRGEAKTVAELIRALEEMQRDDAADLLKPYEFTEIKVPPPGYCHPPSKFSKIPFTAFSHNDIQETRSPEENESPYICYSGTPEDIAAGLQTNIENIIHPNSLRISPSQPRPQVRHPVTMEQSNPRTRNEKPVMSEGSATEGPEVGSIIPFPGVPRQSGMPVVLDKVALVIGNSEYECDKLRGLFYPEQDAEEISKALCKLGFKVVSLVNLTLSEMRIAVLTFCRLLGKGVYAVLYYAGHGYEDSGENFLLPVNANLLYKREDSLCAQEILQTMQECDTALNLLIIDSCRIRLPERAPRPTFVKRGAKGNNIFAYSCCSQQEAHEEQDQGNGLYAQHLLRHIRRNARIECILMDVASDVSRTNNRQISQRPCHESDAYIDCRLTDPVYPAVLPDEFRERVALWQKAHMLPEPFVVLETDELVLAVEFRANFSNVMEVLMITSNKTPCTMTKFVMNLSVPAPVRSDVILVSGDELLRHSQLRQVVKLSALQKLPDKLITKLDVFYERNGQTVKLSPEVNLGCPLVSSVFTEWDWWITCGRSPPTKTTQV